MGTCNWRDAGKGNHRAIAKGERPEGMISGEKKKKRANEARFVTKGGSNYEINARGANAERMRSQAERKKKGSLGERRRTRAGREARAVTNQA